MRRLAMVLVGTSFAACLSFLACTNVNTPSEAELAKLITPTAVPPAGLSCAEAVIFVSCEGERGDVCPAPLTLSIGGQVVQTSQPSSAVSFSSCTLFPGTYPMIIAIPGFETFRSTITFTGLKSFNLGPLRLIRSRGTPTPTATAAPLPR